MRFPVAAVCVAGLGLVVAPARAQDRPIDIPAGPLSQSIATLGAQARVSVVVAVDDPQLWRRSAPAVRGRISVDQALELLLRGSGARAVRAAPGVWRIVRSPRPKPWAQRAAYRKPPADPPPIRDPGEDIVVTASKRDLRLRGFPGAVSIIGGAEFQTGGETGSDAIIARVATVSSTYLGAGRNKLFIRGIADSSFTGPTQATVGQYFGDVRLTYNAPDPDLRLYDIDSVEVLEGPQGTLYGAGSLGGIIRVQRNTPNLNQVEGMLSGGASATWHGAPGGDLAGMVNVPLIDDRVGLRVLGYGVTEGGYIDDPVLGKKDINRSNIAGGRAMLRSRFDRWTLDTGLTYQWTRNDDSQYADRDAPPLTRLSRLPQGSEATYALGEAVLTGDLGDLVSVTSLGVARQRLDERYDASRPDGPTRLFRQHNATNLLSVESRVSRPMAQGYGWIAGISFVRNSTTLERRLGPPDMPAPATGVQNDVSELTGYGEVSVALLPRLVLTAGGRYSNAWLTGEGNDVAPVMLDLRENRAIIASRRESAFLPSVALSATPLSGVTLYARYQESFRPGGLAIEGNFVRRFDNDRARTFELGLRRGAPGESRVDGTLSVSRTLWNDIQADFIDTFGLPSTANIGDGRIWSLSASLGWKPVEGLRVEAGLTVNDSKVTSPSPFLIQAIRAGNLAAATAVAIHAPNAGQLVLEAALGPTRQVPNIADVVARGSIKYDFPVAGDAILSLGAGARYTGKSRLGVGPILGESQGNYLDTRVSARLAFDRYAVTLSATNLTDEVGNRFALGTPFAVEGQQQITPLRPRTIRLGFDTRF